MHNPTTNRPELDHHHRTEARKQLCGTVTLAAGILLFPLYAAVAGWWEGDPTDHAAITIRDLILRVMLASGIVTTVIGVAERRGRNERAITYATYAAVQDCREALAALAALPERMDHLEEVVERLPGYAEGVIQGVTMRRAAARAEQAET